MPDKKDEWDTLLTRANWQEEMLNKIYDVQQKSQLEMASMRADLKIVTGMSHNNFKDLNGEGSRLGLKAESNKLIGAVSVWKYLFPGGLITTLIISILLKFGF